jgi:hypothetical protein
MLISSSVYIDKYLSKTPWEVVAKGKDSTGFFCFVAKLIIMSTLDTSAGFKKVVEKSLRLLKETSFSDECKRRFGCLDMLYKEANRPTVREKVHMKIEQCKQINTAPLQNIRPVLYTARVTSPQIASRLKKIGECWSKKAFLKASTAKALPQLPKEKKKLANDSFRIAICINSCFPSVPNTIDQSLYVAYDGNGKVQAMALASMSKKYTHKIRYLVTNPDNTEVIGTETPVRGAGSALIRHIAKDGLSLRKTGRIALSSTLSARSFYEKLGFAYGDMGLILTKSKIRRLLRGVSATHVMAREEPSFYLKA